MTARSTPPRTPAPAGGPLPASRPDGAPAPRARGRRRAHRASRRRAPAHVIATAVLVLVGTCIMLYPPAASWFSALGQGHEADRYVAAVDGMFPADREAGLGAAQSYNASLADGSRVVDPIAAIQEETVRDGDPYWGLLDPAGDGVMARLRIPSLDLSLPVYHGTGADVLMDGVGHLQGTALPVGGAGTHAVLTGHRGLPQATIFTHLDRLEAGDAIELDVYGRTLLYRVASSTVVLPTQTDPLRAQPGRDLLTLVTCTPLGVNSHRILVQAERVLPLPAEAGAPVEPAGFPWWAVVLGVVVLADAAYVARARPGASATRAAAA
ncbi:class C sortase [Zafaria sp. Z1313]|uniref:class C sortase n=1 Tax=unclassified Zafaria TaxID=2828765 RepID=UPI002E785207|nr:class C sortase [Zafaria sp. J156]MEE1622102.1 class C sortase [Zafaria sp. J156]